MYEVPFKHPTAIDSTAGSRCITTTGVMVSGGGGTSIAISPINSRGDVSQGCEVRVASDAIPELIAALWKAYQHRFGAFDTEIGDLIRDTTGKPVEFPYPGAVYDHAHELTGTYNSTRLEPRELIALTAEQVVVAMNGAAT